MRPLYTYTRRRVPLPVMVVPVSVIIRLIDALTPAVVQVARAVARRPKPEPIPFGRQHFWEIYAPGPGLVRRIPPVCTYCRADQTPDNEYKMCPGPAARR